MDERKMLADRLRDMPAYLSAASKMRESALDTKDVVKLTSGEPDFTTPVHIREAAKEALDSGCTFYTSSRGIPELREAVAEKMKQDYDVDIDPKKEIIITTGGKEAIFITVMGLVNQGDEVFIPDPGYLAYEDNVRFAQGDPVQIPLLEENEFTPEPNDITERMSAKAKMLILNSPSNPTGTVFSRKTLKAIAEIADDRKLFLLADDAYEKFVYDNTKHYNMMQFGKTENKIIIGSFSKTYAMTGWRIGYLIADSGIVEELVKVKSGISMCTNGFVQKAAVAALKGPQLWPEMVKEFDSRRHFLVENLNSIDGIKCPMPKGAFYAFPNISHFGLGSIDFANSLLAKAGVATYPGKTYGSQGEGHIRFTYAASMNHLKEAVKRVRSFVELMN
jgi:aspartate/methionine/tyrosine aminotransferase